MIPLRSGWGVTGDHWRKISPCLVDEVETIVGDPSGAKWGSKWNGTSHNN